MEQITSRENAQIKRYIKLRDQKKQRVKEGAFVIETAKLIGEAILAKVSVDLLFCTSKAIENQWQQIETLQQQGTTVVEIADSLEEKLSLTANAGGMFAVCRLPQVKPVQDLLQQEGHFLYLCQLQDSGNVGTIIRTALAFGLSGLILSSDCPDCYSLKVLRASMGGVFHLPLYWSGQPVSDLATLGEQFDTYAAVVDETATDVTQISFSKRTVIVVGNEGNGLPQEVVASCQTPITICMKGMAESLNAGMAAGILMWEQMRGE